MYSFHFFSIMLCHRTLNIVPCLLTFLVLWWSLPFDSSFFTLSIYICCASSCHEKEIDRGVTQTCVQIQALPFFPSDDVVWLLRHVRLFVTPCTVASQAPLFMGFTRQEYWSGLPFPFPGVPIVTLGRLPTFPQLYCIPGLIMKRFSYLIYFLCFIVFLSPKETSVL